MSFARWFRLFLNRLWPEFEAKRDQTGCLCASAEGSQEPFAKRKP